MGTECTCAVVLSAKVKLIENPDKRCLLVLAFTDVCEAGDAVARVNTHEPIALEGFDDLLLEFIKRKQLDVGDDRLLPGVAEAKGWLICEFGRIGDMEGALAAARACEADLRSAGALDSNVITDAHDQKVLWEFRDAALPATSKVPGLPDLYPGWEDSAVPPAAVGRYLRDLRTLFEKYGYLGSLYGHFGQGCIHVNITFDLHTEAGVEAWKAFLLEAAQLIRRYGGSLSGEHGDGQARAALLPVMYGERVVEAFRAFKRVWDPQNRMNPGKVVDAYAVDVDLREGPPYNPLDPPTYFSFAPSDGGSFAYAANRCVGVGKCRSHESGTMCPSYRVTREERHATRGRARLLFEMLRGSPLSGGWRSEEVKSALDLCLACKGCKHDCPVNVDMATYKAEFLAHHYEGRLRPVWAYAFGLIPWWARLGSRVARLANFVTQAPLLANIAKGAVRMAPQRRIPRFSEPSFKTWYRRRRSNPVGDAGGKRSRSVGRYLQELLSRANRATRLRGAGGRWLRGCRSAAESLLRAAALRLWNARPREAPSSQHHRRAALGARTRYADYRPRTLVRERLQRRAAQPLSRRRRCATPQRERDPPRRFLSRRYVLERAEARCKGGGARTLPS
ncbi:MAG TPA: FAD-linked oxidase C-terminal domain-containing protein [Candidatus Cybelea sp.]